MCGKLLAHGAQVGGGEEGRLCCIFASLFVSRVCCVCLYFSFVHLAYFAFNGYYCCIILGEEREREITRELVVIVRE